MVVSKSTRRAMATRRDGAFVADWQPAKRLARNGRVALVPVMRIVGLGMTLFAQGKSQAYSLQRVNVCPGSSASRFAGIKQAFGLRERRGARTAPGLRQGTGAREIYVRHPIYL